MAEDLTGNFSECFFKFDEKGAPFRMNILGKYPACDGINDKLIKAYNLKENPKICEACKHYIVNVKKENMLM